MLRRTFLGAMAAMSGDVARSQPPVPIIDTHLHFYDPTRPQGVPWPAKDDTVLYRPVLPPEFAKLTAPLGVTGAIVVEASPWLEDNQWVLDLAARYPWILGFVGHLPCGTPEFRVNLMRFGKNRLFRGIRLGDRAIAAGLAQDAFLEDLRRLADAGLELDAIGGAALLPDVLRLSDRLPKLRIVLNHLPYDGADTKTLRELGRRPQIYAKVSGVVRPDGAVPIDELWDTFGADQLIYASNWPVSDKAAPYSTVLKTVRDYFGKKGPEASGKFFSKNALRAYDISVN